MRGRCREFPKPGRHDVDVGDALRNGLALRSDEAGVDLVPAGVEVSNGDPQVDDQ